MFGSDRIWREMYARDKKSKQRLERVEKSVFSLINRVHLSSNQSENVVKGTTSTVTFTDIPTYAKGIMVFVEWDTQATAFELRFGPSGETLDDYHPKIVSPASFVSSQMILVPVAAQSIDIEVVTAAGAMTVATTLTLAGYWT